MYIFSPSTSAYYPIKLKEELESAGVWPTDGIEIEESVFNELSQPAPVGKIRIIEQGQLPTLIDISSKD